MLKIKSILLGLVSFSFFAVTFVSAQVYCAPTDYTCLNNLNNTAQVYSNSNINYRPTNTQKYPELCSVLSRTMAFGDTGNDVKRMQVALGQEGIAYIGSTGYFGPVTKSAVQIFQLRNGIRQTGAVGPITLARMQSLWCGGQPGNSGNTPSGYINTNNNGQLEVSIAPISSSFSNITLGWNSKFANSCDINGELVQISGQKVLALYNETTYTITCVGYNGSRVSKSIVLRPNQIISNLPSINLSINPTSALINTYATLFWTTANAYSCTLNNQNIPTSGSQQILVTNAQTAYQLTCISQSGQQVSSTVYANPGSNNNLNISSASISANLSTVSSGQPVTLTWSSINTLSCAVTGGTTTFTGTNGSQVVYPTLTTVYTIACYGNTSGPQVTNQVIVTVPGSSNTTPTVTVSASPLSITTGQATTLTWSSTNSTYCNILTSSGTSVASNLSVSGTRVVYPTVSGNYQVICYNSTGQSNSAFVNITVNGTSGTGNVTVSTNPINVGEVENIAWNISTTTNPKGLILSLYDSNNTFYGNITRINTFATSSSFAWTIPKVVFDSSNDAISCITVDGQQYCGGSPKQVLTGTYKIRATLFTPSNACFGFCQPVSGQKILGTYDSSNFTINTSTTANNITATMTSNPNTVAVNQASVLSWTSTNATYCNVINPSGTALASNQSTSGNFTVYPTNSGNYQVTCFNANGQSANAYSYITVNGSTANVTATITASPNPISSGQPVTITWTSTNANYCNISANNISLLYNQSTSGSTVVYPSMSTNYQLNCYNNNGQNAANFVYVTTNGTSTVTPTANIYASTQSVTSGQSLTLNWYSSNANTCSLYGNNNLLISNQNTSGSYLVYPNQTTNYQITCTNNSSGQTANSYVTVTVNGSSSGNNISLVSNYNRLVTVQINNSSCASGGYLNWGDGQTSQVPNQCGIISLTHQYPYTGSFNLNLYLGSSNGNLQVYVQ